MTELRGCERLECLGEDFGIDETELVGDAPEERRGGVRARMHDRSAMEADGPLTPVLAAQLEDTREPLVARIHEHVGERCDRERACSARRGTGVRSVGHCE